MEEEVLAAEPDPVTILDERIQKRFDDAVIAQHIQKLRELLAAAKVNRILAQRGLLARDQDLHPAKFDQAIRQHRAAIDILVGLAETNEATETGLSEHALITVPAVAPIGAAEGSLDPSGIVP